MALQDFLGLNELGFNNSVLPCLAWPTKAPWSAMSPPTSCAGLCWEPLIAPSTRMRFVGAAKYASVLGDSPMCWAHST
jgi:hypothetical protein